MPLHSLIEINHSASSNRAQQREFAADFVKLFAESAEIFANKFEDAVNRVLDALVDVRDRHEPLAIVLRCLCSLAVIAPLKFLVGERAGDQRFVLLLVHDITIRSHS